MISLSRAELQSLMGIDRQAIDAIRDAYIAITDGRANVPPVGYLALEGRNADCHIKYGYIDGDPVFVVKIASGFYDNPARGLPSSNGIIVAISAETGATVALLNDEGWLTDLRTAIGGAVASHALCRKDSRRVAIVGTGTQARLQIEAHAAIMPDQLNFVVWGRDVEKAAALADAFKSSAIEVEAAQSLEAACRAADIIVTTTPSTTPLVSRDWVRPGTHVTAIGADSPGKRELDSALVAAADVRAMDMASQSLDHGEFAAAHAAGLIGRDDCVELGAILSGRAAGRISRDQITIVDLTGVATQDIAIARTAIARATHERDTPLPDAA